LKEIKDRQEGGDIGADGNGGGSAIVGAGRERSKGSFPDGDPHTTNIYIGCLAPTTTEEHLMDLFGQYGPINSVKVMWPRTEEERLRNRNCGFVSFKMRADAEDALIELQDYNLDGYKMVLGWGKAVKISAAPFILPKKATATAPSTAIAAPAPVPVPVPTPVTASVATTASAASTNTTTNTTSGKSQSGGDAAPATAATAADCADDDDIDGAPVDLVNMSVENFLDSVTATTNNDKNSSTHTQAVASEVDPPIAHTSTSIAPAASATATTTAHATTTTAGPGSQSRKDTADSHMISSPGDETRAAAARAKELLSKKNVYNIQIVPPQDPKRRAFIDLLAKYVAADGQAFEKAIKVKEEENPDFAFLYYNSHHYVEEEKRNFCLPMGLPQQEHEREQRRTVAQEAMYYRWRTYANVWGDTAEVWHDDPQQWTEMESNKEKEEEEESADLILIITPPTAPATSNSKSSNKRKLTHDRDSHIDHDGPQQLSHIRNKRRHNHPEEEDGSGRDGMAVDSDDAEEEVNDASTKGVIDYDLGRIRRATSRTRDSRSPSPEGGRELFDSTTTTAAAASSKRASDRSSSSSSSSLAAAAAAAAGGRYAGMTGAQIERARNLRKSTHLTRLSKSDYQEWSRKLQSLSLSRQVLKEAMGFAFDKMEAGEEIVSLIRDKLVLPSQYPAVKIAGLYLLSDILHNAGAPIKHASNYRNLVQSVLPELIFDIAETRRKGATGRMSAMQIDERVHRLLSVWADWSVFPSGFVVGLQAVLAMTENEYSQLKQRIHSAKLQHEEKKREQEQQEMNISVATAGAAASTAADIETEREKRRRERLDAELEEIEQWRRRARQMGVVVHRRTSLAALQCWVEYVEQYVHNRFGSDTSITALPAISTLLTSTGSALSSSSGSGGQDKNDGDNANIDGEVLGSMTVLEKMVYDENKMQQGEKHTRGDDNNQSSSINDDNEDMSDIDGVPLMYEIPGREGPQNRNQPDDDDDIDGAPLS